MKRDDLRLVTISTQTIVSVVLSSPNTSSIVFSTCKKVWNWACRAQVICIDEAPCSIMDWFIIGVYVEKSWGDNTPLC